MSFYIVCVSIHVCLYSRVVCHFTLYVCLYMFACTVGLYVILHCMCVYTCLPVQYKSDI